MTTTQAVKHTPGPWEQTANGDSIYRIERDGEGIITAMEYVCSVSHNQHERLRPQRDSNARLIAAAPEMLEALEISGTNLSLLHSDGCPQGLSVNTCECPIAKNWRRVEAAIRKAKGEL